MGAYPGWEFANFNWKRFLCFIFETFKAKLAESLDSADDFHDLLCNLALSRPVVASR